MPGERKMEKVLIFSSRETCYSSSNFFAYQLGAAFEELGFKADICELSAGDELDAKLKPLLLETYRVIVDFNSMLPRMELEDGTPYLDRLSGPFFDYILDHPLFHYTGLTSGVKNLHVITLDIAQAEYVKKYYPQIAAVYMLPLGATKAIYEGKKEEECRILFSGTYESPETDYNIVRKAPKPLKSIMQCLIDRRIANPLIPMEEILYHELFHAWEDLPAEQFALCMNSMYAVDIYVRNYFRKKVLDMLLTAGIPVTVIGEGWEQYHCTKENTLRRERGVPFALSFERIAKAHILLNVSPIFNRGMHDRILAGMANKTVVLTDENPYLKAKLKEGYHVCFYSLERMESLVEQAEILLTNNKFRTEIAENAYQEFETHHTWKHRAVQILAWADEIVNKNTKKA